MHMIINMNSVQANELIRLIFFIKKELTKSYMFMYFLWNSRANWYFVRIIFAQILHRFVFAERLSNVLHQECGFGE